MTAPTHGTPSVKAHHAAFLAIVPRIERHGRVYFRGLKNPDRREEAIAEMVALAWKWFLRLVELGKDPTGFPSALATYAARAVRSGRRLCGQEKAKDVLSRLAQQRHGFATSPLPPYSTLSGSPLEDALADNTVSPVPEQVAFRIDFPDWLETYDERRRRVIEDLMLGQRTLDVAETHRLSPGRVTQLRREFLRDWHRFHGESVSSAV